MGLKTSLEIETKSRDRDQVSRLHHCELALVQVQVRISKHRPQCILKDFYLAIQEQIHAEKPGVSN